MVPTDKLDIIVAKQKELQAKLGYDFDKMSAEDKVHYIKEYVLHATDELHETLRELPYIKPWKVYPTSDEQTELAFMLAAREFADVIHFIINIALGLGLSANDIFHLYLDKNDENYIRQTKAALYKKCVEDE